MITNDILVCITNHNSNNNSKTLKDNLSKFFDTIIIDSKSNIIEDFFDIKLENVYYTGLYNESVKQTIELGKKYLFFIASDVFIEDYEKMYNIITELDDEIYLWAPSTNGQSHIHCKPKMTDNYREVPYLEGFCFLTHIDCTDRLNPISLDINKYGFGIDLLLGYNCVRTLKKKCVVDDRITVYHKEGTGYDQGKALTDMYHWMLYNFDQDVNAYTMLYSTSPGQEKLLNFLNGR